MLQVSDLVDRRVLLPKKPKKSRDGSEAEQPYQRLGRVSSAVFSPDGERVVGFMVRRPDLVGVVKRDDVFLALDSFEREDGQLKITRPKDGTDEAAIRRLGLDWDACIIWVGMDVQTVEGKSLGYVSDAEFDETTGRVERFSSTGGSVSRALLGSFSITPDMVVGYRKGRMVVDPGGRSVQLDGGLAAAAGEGYARAKVKGSELGQKVGEVAGKAADTAVDKGGHALGRAIGKAKRAISEAADEGSEAREKARVKAQAEPAVPEIEAADVRVERPAEGLPEQAVEVPSKRPEPKTYVPVTEGAGEGRAAGEQGSAQKPAAEKPAAKKPAATKTTAQKPTTKASATTGEKVARAAGRQLGSLGKMFGSFKEEFDKASK